MTIPPRPNSPTLGLWSGELGALGERTAAQTMIKLLFEFGDLGHGAVEAVNALSREPVFLHCRTAFLQDRRHIDVVSGHLFKEINPKRCIPTI